MSFANMIGLGRGRGIRPWQDESKGNPRSSTPDELPRLITKTTIIPHALGRGRGFVVVGQTIESVYDTDRMPPTQPPSPDRVSVMRDIKERPREAFKFQKSARQVRYWPVSRGRRRPRVVYPSLCFHARPEDFDRLAFSATICAGHQHQLGLDGCMAQPKGDFPMLIRVTFWPRYPGRTPRLQFKHRPGY